MFKVRNSYSERHGEKQFSRISLDLRDQLNHLELATQKYVEGTTQSVVEE